MLSVFSKIVGQLDFKQDSIADLFVYSRKYMSAFIFMVENSVYDCDDKNEIIIENPLSSLSCYKSKSTKDFQKLFSR